MRGGRICLAHSPLYIFKAVWYIKCGGLLSYARKEHKMDDGEEVVRLNRLSRVIIDSAMLVHSALGPGMLESAYEACLHTS